MNDQNPAATELSSERLAQFQDEVAKLKVTGGGANPERLGAQWGIGLTIVGFVVAIVAYWSALDSKSTNTQLRSQIIAIIGIGLALVGIVIWVRNSITRYLRYWIIRLVYEQREQTDALIKALRDKQ
jgi:hypothetical protein